MNNIQLISEEYVKERLPVRNLDSANLVPCIELAQDRGLQQLIGTVLFSTICEAVADGTIDTKPDLKTLLDDYVQPYLLWQTMYEAYTLCFAKARSTGIVQTTTDHVQVLTRADVDYMKSDAGDKANFYGERMTQFLKANSTKYPEFFKRRNVADMKAEPCAFICPIYLG